MKLYRKWKFSNLLPVLLVSIFFIAACADSEAAYKHSIRRAEKYTEEGKYPEARIELLNSLKNRPGNPTALKLLAEVSMEMKDFRQALSAYRELLDKDPDNSEITVRYSRILVAGKAYSAATEVLEGYLQRNEDHWEILSLLSQCYAGTDQQDKATQTAKKATALAPDEPEAWLNLSQVLLGAGNLTEAESALSRARKIDPQSERVLLGTVNFYLAQRQFEEAEKLLKDLAISHPENLTYNLNYYEILITNGKIVEAENYLRNLIEFKNESILWNRLGNNLRSQGKRDEAVNAWEKAIELDKNYIQARLNLAEMSYREGNPEDALNYVHSVLEIDSANPGALALRGAMRIDEQRYVEAASDLDTAAAKNPARQDWRILLAKAQAGSGDRQTARQTLRSLIEDFPENKQGRMILARLEKALGSIDGSSSHARLLSRDPVYGPEAMWMMGDNYMREGKMRSAEDVFRRTEDFFPAHLETSFRVAKSVEAQGRVDEALGIYRDALENNPGHPIILESMAQLFLKTGRPDEAVNLVDDYTSEGSPEVYSVMLASMLERAGRTREAEGIYRELLEGGSVSQTVYRRLIELLVREKNLEEAKLWIEGAMEKNPDLPGFRFLYAMTLDAEGDRKSANTIYRELLQAMPGHLPSMNNLAWNLALEGNYKEAIQISSQAVQQAPEDPFILDTHGWIFHLMGEDYTALEYLRSAVQRAPNHPEIVGHLTEVLKALGREEEAKVYLEAIER